MPGERFARGAVADQFDAGDQAALADVADVRMLRDAGEMFAEPGDFWREAGERLFFVKDVDRKERDGRAERVAAYDIVAANQLPFAGSASQTAAVPVA